MFSGIIEGQAKVEEVKSRDFVYELILQNPSFLDDLKIGDSVAVDGICLTVSHFSPDRLHFILGPETVKLTKRIQVGDYLNIERSLRFGDRVHGHLVSGHVDGMASVVHTEKLGESFLFAIKIPENLSLFVWKKGSLSVNGVSLTINKVIHEKGSGSCAEFCLIPETLKRTNLGSLKLGDLVNIEVDSLARGLFHLKEHQL